MHNGSASAKLGDESEDGDSDYHETKPEIDIKDLHLLTQEEVQWRQRNAISFLEAESKVLSQLGLQPKPPTFTRSEHSAVSTTSLLRKQASALMACITVELSLTTITSGSCPGCTVSLGLSAELVTDPCSLCYTWRIESVLGFSIGVHLIGFHIWIGATVTGRIEPQEVPCLRAKESNYCEIQDVFLTQEQLQDGLWASRCHTSNPFTIIMSYIEVQLRGVRKYLASKIEDTDLFRKGYVGTDWLKALTLEGAMEKALQASEKLEEYPKKFIEDPGAHGATSVQSVKGDALTWLMEPNVDCKKHELLQQKGVPLEDCKLLCAKWPNQLCTLVVMGQKDKKYDGLCWLKSTFKTKSDRGCQSSTTRDSYFMYRSEKASPAELSEGNGTESTGLDWLDPASLAKQEGWLTVRAVRGQIHGRSSPSSYVRINFVRRGAKILDWESSYVMFDSVPVWDEVASIPVHMLHGSELDVVISVMDASKTLDDEVGGATFRVSLPKVATVLHTGGGPPEQCRLPCRRRFHVWQYSNAGSGALSSRHAGKIELEIRWIPRPEAFADFGLKDEVVTPLWAAYDSFNGKLPDFAAQLMSLVLDSSVTSASSKFQKQLPEQALDGVGLARWNEPRADTDGMTPEELKEHEKARKARIKENKVKGFCSSSNIDAADSEGGRVINMMHVLRTVEAKSNVNLATTRNEEGDTVAHVDFYVELAMSAGNLFLRTISDIHAMFSVYFADSAAWAGECSALPPSFELLYEDMITSFADSVRLGMLSAHEMRSVMRSTSAGIAGHLSARRSHPSKRVSGPDKTITKKASRVSDEDNPWCNREWVGGSPAIADQLDFAKRDPPTRGKDQGFTQKGEHKGSIYAQLWCEVAQQWRLAPDFRKGNERKAFLEATMDGNMVTDSEDLEKKAESWANTAKEEGSIMGRTMRYESSCRRLSPQLHKDPKTDKVETHYVWEYREDCEIAKLSPAFVTIFKNFFGQINIHFARIGGHLEEALRCAGQNIPEKARQFPRTGDSSFHCLGSVRTRDQRASIARYHFLTIIHEIRTFLIRLGAPFNSQTSEETVRSTVMQDFAKDLNKAAQEERWISRYEEPANVAKLDLVESTGAIRFVVEEFVKAEKLKEPWNTFTERIQKILQKPPWSLKRAQMHDIISTIASSTDMTKFRGESYLSKLVPKMHSLPFEKKDSCKGMEETATEELMECWQISSMELESVQAATYLERIRSARDLSYVRAFQKIEMCHWALHGYFNNVFDCASNDGVWMFGKALVTILARPGHNQSQVPRDMVMPQSQLRWVRLFRHGNYFHLQHVEPWSKASSEEPDWAVTESNVCVQDVKVERCFSVPLASATITFADWPADKNLPISDADAIDAGLRDRSLKISTEHADVFLLMVAPDVPDGLTLTAAEQLQASKDTAAAWKEEITMHQQDIYSKKGDRSDTVVRKMATFWMKGMPSRTQEYKIELIKEKVADHAGSVWDALKSGDPTIGAASAIARTHDHFFRIIFQSKRLQRPEMLQKVRESLNGHLAGTLFQETFKDDQQVGQDDIKNLIQRDRVVSASEVSMAWNYASDAQLRALESNYNLQLLRRLINEAILDKQLRSTGAKRPDTDNYVVFAGKALLALEEADPASSCCCKTSDLRKLFVDWCGNPLARTGKLSGESVCCKRKAGKRKHCPSSGYTQLAPDNLCMKPPPKDKSISPVEHAFRLIVKPEGAYIQFLSETISRVDTVEWETSVEACATLGHERCRQFQISCRHRVSVARETAVVEGVEQRFAQLGSITMIVDDIKMRMVPLREGSFVLESTQRWDKEMHMRTALAIWERSLKEFATKTSAKCKPSPRAFELTSKEFSEISQGTAMDILGTTRDLVGKLELKHQRWDAMAFLAWEQRCVMNNRVVEAQHVGSSFVVDSPFDAALASLSHSQSECCSMKPNAECKINEELLPLSCTLIYAKQSQKDMQTMPGMPAEADGSGGSAADGSPGEAQADDSVDINLGKRGWNLLAAMDLDFHIAFSYFRPPTFGGEPPKPLLLTGLLWSALPEVLRDFSAAEKVENRKKLLKRHLAYAFRQESIATGKSVKLPYPPIKYESSVEIRLTAGVKIGEWSGVESPCEPPKKWAFGYRHRTVGNSWSDHEASEHCLMAQGVVSVIGISIHIERCWHLTAGDEEPQEESAKNGTLKKWIEEPEWYDVWRFELFSVMSDKDSLLKTKLKEGTKFVKKLFKNGWKSVTSGTLLDTPDFLQFGDSVQSTSLLGKLGKVTVVELAKAVLGSPTSFLSAAASGAGAMLGAVGGMLASVAYEVMKVVKDKIVSWAVDFAKATGLDQVGKALKIGWNWVKEHVGVDSKMRQCLRVGMTLSRPSYSHDLAPWTKEYEMHYLTFTTLEMRITVPGVVKVSAILAYVSDMNLSNYLNMLMNFLFGKATNSRLDSCLSCFACGALTCDKKQGKGSHGSGELHMFCADERSNEDKRKKKEGNASYEVALTKGVDRCMKAATAEDRCGHAEKDGEEEPPQRLIEIIEDCQSLIPTGAAMS